MDQTQHIDTLQQVINSLQEKIINFQKERAAALKIMDCNSNNCTLETAVHRTNSRAILEKERKEFVYNNDITFDHNKHTSFWISMWDNSTNNRKVISGNNYDECIDKAIEYFKCL